MTIKKKRKKKVRSRKKTAIMVSSQSPSPNPAKIGQTQRVRTTCKVCLSFFFCILIFPDKPPIDACPDGAVTGEISKSKLMRQSSSLEQDHLEQSQSTISIPKQ